MAGEAQVVGSGVTEFALFYETGGTLEPVGGIVSTVSLSQRVPLSVLQTLHLSLLHLQPLLTRDTLHRQF